MPERRTALPEPRPSRAPAVRASAAIGRPLEWRGRIVCAVVGFDAATRGKNQEIDSPALTASLAALQPGAIALDNALRVQRAERLSVIDGLSQLYNSRYRAPRGSSVR
jgi:hypothetical protein